MAEDSNLQAASPDIKHRTIHVNNINIHLAESGPETGPVILFIHGFPELWYTWRHQMRSLSSHGYRTVAPDMRGYGETDAPKECSQYTYGHIVGDLVGLIDELEVDKVFVVAHDWGALVAWWLCLFRPDRVIAMEPGEMEAEVEEAGGADVLLKKIFAYRTPGPLFLPKGQAFDDLPSYPSWLTQADIAYYRDTFTRTGFTGGFNYYRAIQLNWEVTAPWAGAQVRVPVKFIVGDLDLTYHMKGAKEYLHSGKMKNVVPFLQEVVILEGVGHFLQEETPDVVSNHILDFIQQF
ncbi:hypothetical protein KSS87_005478 [Heliosperma pusillum]|nr:hypothetical protein KSS87_005478 [Heliosperma pusillum]